MYKNIFPTIGGLIDLLSRNLGLNLRVVWISNGLRFGVIFSL
jgi:hypothetical protein